MGFCGIFKHFSGFEFFLLPNRIHAHPHAGTDYLQCQVFGMQFGKSIFRRSVTAARAAVFFISRQDFPFFGNASPSPNSSFGIGGISASARCPILEVPPQMKTRTAVKRRRSRFLGGEPILPELCLPRVPSPFLGLSFRGNPGHFYRKILALSETVSPSAPLISSSGAFFHHSSGIVTGNRPRVSNFPNSAFASARIEGSRILYAQR